MIKKHRIYLDHAATTPLDPRVLEAMMPYLKNKFGNPMSLHSYGREASEAVEKARLQVSKFLNCNPEEIIFTSGATESNNLALKGVVKAYWNKFKKKPHVITSQFEHHCILTAAQSLERKKLAEVTYLPVYKDGVVRVKDVKKAIKKNTALVSIMYVNNEIGTVQPVTEIGKFLKLHNFHISHPKSHILFHTDATQAVNYFDCNIKKLGVDLLSLSGHKIYGPKGVGALYVRRGTPIKRIQEGGEQEKHMRAGTHNVPGIVGLGETIELVKINRETEARRLKKIRDYLIKRVLKEIPKSYLNGSITKRSPANANFRFDNVEGEGIILSLDMAGIAASTGSACSTGTLEPSHVLMSLGLKPEQAHGSLRLTLGKNTTKKDIDYTIDKLKQVIERLRNISGNILSGFK